MIITLLFIIIGIVLQTINAIGATLHLFIPTQMQTAIMYFLLKMIVWEGYINIMALIAVIGWFLGFIYYFLLWKLFRLILSWIPWLRHDNTSQLFPIRNQLDLSQKFPSSVVDLRGIKAGKGIRRRQGNTRDIL